MAAVAQRIAAAPHVHALRLTGIWHECALAALLPCMSALTALTALDLISLVPPNNGEAPSAACTIRASAVWPHLATLTGLQKLSVAVGLYLPKGEPRAEHAHLLHSLTELFVIVERSHRDGITNTGSVGLTQVAQQLAGSAKLQVLSVSADLSTKAALRAMRSLLRSLPGLQRVRLASHERMLPKRARNLVEEAAATPGLTSLSLSGRSLIRQIGRAPAEADAVLGTMQLQLGANLTGTELRALGRHRAALTQLCFEGAESVGIDDIHAVDPCMSADNAVAVARALAALTALTSLTFRQTDCWSDQVADDFVANCGMLTQLLSLEVPGDASMLACLQALAPHFGCMPRLQHLPARPLCHHSSEQQLHLAVRGAASQLAQPVREHQGKPARRFRFWLR